MQKKSIPSATEILYLQIQPAIYFLLLASQSLPHQCHVSSTIIFPWLGRALVRLVTVVLVVMMVVGVVGVL